MRLTNVTAILSSSDFKYYDFFLLFLINILSSFFLLFFNLCWYFFLLFFVVSVLCKRNEKKVYKDVFYNSFCKLCIIEGIGFDKFFFVCVT